MSDDLEKQREITINKLNEFVQNRIKYYRGESSSSPSIKRLLSKDVIMYAARGVETSDEFVIEAFHALESSSEETVMGNTWQAILAAISDDTIDSGDLTTLRDGCLYVCELKAQTNTVNSSSFPSELRALKDKIESQSHFARASKQPIKAAFCVVRGGGKHGIDETRTYEPANPYDHTNDDLRGFEYRYLVGAKFWQWLTGADSAEGLLDDLSRIETSGVREARNACLNKLIANMNDMLDEKSLPHTVQGVLELKKSS